MEKKTVVDQIEITRNGTVQVRLRKVLVNDDGTLDDLGYHRSVIPPGTDPDEQMALVNTHLEQMKMGRVASSELGNVRAICKLVHTPEQIAIFKAEQEQIREEQAALDERFKTQGF